MLFWWAFVNYICSNYWNIPCEYLTPAFVDGLSLEFVCQKISSGLQKPSYLGLSQQWFILDGPDSNSSRTVPSASITIDFIIILKFHSILSSLARFEYLGLIVIVSHFALFDFLSVAMLDNKVHYTAG